MTLPEDIFVVVALATLLAAVLVYAIDRRDDRRPPQ